MNPLRGCYLNGFWYRYVPESFRGSVQLKNVVNDTQGASPSRLFSIQGSKPADFTITLALENNYQGISGTGSTTWVGISRLAHLLGYLGSLGTSQPITFVTPYGVTYGVVPVGTVDIDPFNPENPSSDGMEFRVSISLSSV
jgi:hypothetical protein